MCVCVCVGGGGGGGGGGGARIQLLQARMNSYYYGKGWQQNTKVTRRALYPHQNTNHFLQVSGANSIQA